MRPDDFGNITPKFDKITPDLESSGPRSPEKKFSPGDKVLIKGSEGEGVYVISGFIPETGHAILNKEPRVDEDKTVSPERLARYSE